MPNNCLSVLYKHIIQVENKNVGLKGGGGHKHTIDPPIKKVGGVRAPLAPPLPTPVVVEHWLEQEMALRAVIRDQYDGTMR